MKTKLILTQKGVGVKSGRISERRENSRREFLKRIFSISLPALLRILSKSPLYSLQRISEQSIVDEEHYWNLVREHFILSKKGIYLNNGSIGISPRIVVEAVIRNIDRFIESLKLIAERKI